MDDFLSLVLLMVMAHPYRPKICLCIFYCHSLSEFSDHQVWMFYMVILKKKLTKRISCFAYNTPHSPDLKALGSGIHLLLSLHIREKSVQINQKLAFVNVFNCSHHTVPFYSRFLLNVSDGKIWCRFQTDAWK